MATYGYTFTSGDTVTPTKLNTARTITDIVNADIKSDAAIAGTKIAPDFGSQNAVTTGTVTAGKLVPSGTSATGSGLYLPVANTVAISTNGGERLRVDATGNTAIGTTTTAAAKLTVADASANDALRITQTGAGNALVVEDVATDGSPTVIDASGNVTIGHTSAPTVASAVHPLNVVGAGAAIARAAADAVGAAITFVKSRSTSIGGTRAIVVSGDELGAIEFAADNGANLNTVGASISAVCDGTAGSADMPARIVFRTTADGAASPTERMRITNAGNVGIGKTPTTALDVNGTVTATAFAGHLTGNASSATELQTARNIALTGDVTGTASFDGTANASIAATIAAGVIMNADINSAADIAGSKVDPNFAAQNVVTTGTATAAKLIPTGTSAVGNGMYLPAANSVGISTNGSERLRINSAGILLFGSSTDVSASATGYKVDPDG